MLSCYQKSFTFQIFSNYLLVSVLATICYINSCGGDFVFDDNEAIIQNKDVDPDTSLLTVFKNDFWGMNISLKSSHKSYRPLTIMTFRWNYWLSQLQPFGYHLTNVILHVLVSATFLQVCSCLDNGLRCFTKEPVAKKGHSRFALLAALLFAVHPIHTETVAGVVGRAELTSALCYLIGFLLYLSACNDESIVRGFFMVLITFVCAIFATFFKEQGITLMGVCLCYDIVHMEIDPNQVIRKQVPTHSSKEWRCFCMRLSTSVLLTVLLLVGRMSTGAPTFKPEDNPASFENSTAIRIINYNYLYSLNLWLLLNPWWLCFDWSMGCVPLITSASDRRITAVICFWIGIGSLIFYCLFAKQTQFKQLTMVSLGMLVIPFLPASNVLLQVGFVLAERVLYLPSCGFCLLISLGMSRLDKYVEKKVSGVMAVFLIVLFTTRSMHRSMEWLSEDVLFTSGIGVCPLNAKVLYNIGKVKTDKGEANLAEMSYRQAIRLYPQYDQALNNLGNLLKETGRENEAEAILSKAVTVNPLFAAAWMNLGIVQAALNKTEEAENSYKKALQNRKQYPDAYYNMGNLYISTGQAMEAVSALKNAIQLQNDHQNAWSNLGLLYENLEMFDEAESTFKSALRAIPDNAHLYYSLGVLMGRMQKLEEGKNYLLKALHLNPMSAKCHANLGVIYHLQKIYNKAMDCYREALSLDSTLETAADNLKKLERTIIL